MENYRFSTLEYKRPDLDAYRAKLKENGEALGLSKITINDMVLFAVARILPKYPEINANLVCSFHFELLHCLACSRDNKMIAGIVRHSFYISFSVLGTVS